MRAGLTTSFVLHAAALGFGLFTLSAPAALEVMDVEAFPVDIIPVESITQIQEGDKKAPLAEKSSPVPTKRPDIVPDAVKTGDNKMDTEAPPTPEPTPKPVETAAVPAPSPEPTPKPAPEKPREVTPAKPEPVAAPATEVTPEPTPKQEVTPDPVTETIVAETAAEEAVKLPESVPSPEARPKPPQATTAKAPERKETEKPATEAAAKPKSEEKEFDADEVAALLTKEKPSGGGAKRSTQEASLGGKKATGGSKLSQSEMDALRGQLSSCWSVPAGAVDGGSLRVTVRFNLDRAGTLTGAPSVETSSGDRAFDSSAVRAVNVCSNRGFNLPADKYDTWSEVVVNFDPSEMF
ncbi:MAG: TonB family protein [Rhizobiaceae bacterium]